MGYMVGSATIDERGRIVIPNEIRLELNLRPEQKFTIRTEGREVILIPSVSAEEFARELKGCVSRSKVKAEDLKEIWGVSHSHD